MITACSDQHQRGNMSFLMLIALSGDRSFNTTDPHAWNTQTVTGHQLWTLQATTKIIIIRMLVDHCGLLLSVLCTIVILLLTHLLTYFLTYLHNKNSHNKIKLKAAIHRPHPAYPMTENQIGVGLYMGCGDVIIFAIVVMTPCCVKREHRHFVRLYIIN